MVTYIFVQLQRALFLTILEASLSNQQHKYHEIKLYADQFGNKTPNKVTRLWRYL